MTDDPFDPIDQYAPFPQSWEPDPSLVQIEHRLWQMDIVDDQITDPDISDGYFHSLVNGALETSQWIETSLSAVLMTYQPVGWN